MAANEAPVEDRSVRRDGTVLIRLLFSLVVCLAASRIAAGEMERVRVSDDGRGFVLEKSRKPFVPWGFNYDHDERGRLLEDYWDSEWPKIEEDFHEMKQLGANVVRMHLQFGKFMRGPSEPNEATLKQYGRLVALAEKTHLYLDVTGLGCYHKKDVPKWYDRLSEEGRWAAQARFWEAVAGRSAGSPAVFCYDLMNEPVVPGGDRKPEDWLGPEFAGSCFVQCITLSQAGRPRPAIARGWIQWLSAAIRKHDRRHLITVGLVDWSLDRPGLTSGFVPGKIAGELDFLCVHVYPEAGKVAAALDTLSGFAVGKPVVIEETFPLACSVAEFERFLSGSRKRASGWIGFYWGETPDEYRRSKTIADAMMLGWLELFQKRAKEYTSGAANFGGSTSRDALVKDRATFVFACDAKNDLYRALGGGASAPPRYDGPSEALSKTPQNGALLILADGYSAKTTALPEGLFRDAAAKNVRLFVEYPGSLPDLGVAPPVAVKWERAVVASAFFGADLPRLRILGIHDCHFVRVTVASPHLAAARVAGYDTAIFGLPNEASPLLFEHPTQEHVLVSTTKLSQFVTARYAPNAAWGVIWPKILAWLQPGKALPKLDWAPAVRPSSMRDEPLPPDAEQQALRRGAEWFFNARMLIHPDWLRVFEKEATTWTDRVGPPPQRDWPCGDGSLGVLEGFASRIDSCGGQLVRWYRRHDCNGETAGAMALAGAALGEERYKTVAANLVDWLYTRSAITGGKRADPKNPAYGLMGWGDTPECLGVYYADDCERGLRGVFTAAAVLKTDRWDQRAMRGLLANLRLTGSAGFQPWRIDEPDLERLGWRHYFQSPDVCLDMNYQASLWAGHLWAYRQTGYHLFLERAKAGIRKTMQAYPDNWTWTESMQLERGRLLLPLAWLVRIENTPEHRGWLRRIAGDVLALQDRCGAIREDLGPAGHGTSMPPRSNADYGTSEATLIQSEGDPATDLLYTINFVFLGLHEAAAATGEPFYRNAEDKLAEFFCRAQIRAPGHPEFDGAWFRAFDYRLWDYWASNADAGWGAWSIETGWTQTTILSTFALRRLRTSLWDLTSASKIGRTADACRRELELPEEKR
jgi:hypothetical protein